MEIQKKRNTGKNFEEQTKIFFSFLFKELGYKVHKERMQFNGTQDGFDILFVIADQYIERNIYIECKDYSTDLKFGNLYAKAHDLETTHQFGKNDISLFISPRANFGNNRNPEKSEPIFNNGKFSFNIRLLELNNGVNKLFAIHPDVYQKIYDQECKLDIDEDDEIENFKSILFSRGPLKKIIIKENDKIKYLTDIQPKENYISRTLSIPKFTKEQEKFGQLPENSFQTINLIEATYKLTEDNEKTGLVILGNPGTGKSVELEELALYYWDLRETKNWVPFYREINNFQTTDSITNFLPNDWNNIPQLLIILDGLDEIAYSQKFRSKLETFIIENETESQRIKFVLSCRTNIYENVIKDISKFNCYLLDNVPYHEALQYLNKKFNLSFDNYAQLSFNKNHKEFFENPYYLNLFGEYYIEHKKLPNNKSDLLEKYVSQRLEDDRKRKYKNKPFDKSAVINSCKKVALSMEAMQQNHIKESSLLLLLGPFKDQFIKSCFIEKVFGKDNWKFEHRNLQEFFAAKAMTNLDFEDIINFIKLDENTNKTHPSWLNSISYLISLLDKESLIHEQFINWLSEYDSEVLFKADSNRIPKNVRIKVFQDYFKKRCKEDKLWIRSYDSDVIEFAKFGDCDENLIYLKKELADHQNHRRVRISALDLLSYMNFQEHKEDLKNLIIALMSSPINEVNYDFKTDALHVAQRIILYKDHGFLSDVIVALGNIDYHRVTNALLYLIENSNSEDYFEYIKALTPKILDENKRNHKKQDNYSTNEKETLKRIINKFKGLKTLMFALKLGIQNEYRFKISNEDLEGIISKITKIHNKDKTAYDWMINFTLRTLRNNNRLFHFEEIIASFFHKTGTNGEAFKTIYKSAIKLDIKRFFISYLLDEDVIKFFIKEFKNEHIQIQEAIYFRNIINRIDFDLAKLFETLIINETGYQFNENYLDKDLQEKWKEFHKSETSRNFDLLFKKDKIKKISIEYFKHIGKKVITYDDSEDNRKVYWESIELQEKFPKAFIDICYDTLRNNEGEISTEDINELIDTDLYLINLIEREITSNQKEVEITDFHRQFIENWCFENLIKADFKNTYTGSRYNQILCELICLFRDLFSLDFPEDITLNMLHVDCFIESNTGKRSGLKYILKKVDKSKIDIQIIDNLKEGISKDCIFENHALYAIDNDLSEAFPIIKKYIESDKNGKWLRKRILQKFIEKVNDLNLLKSLVQPSLEGEYYDGLTWEAVTLLLEKEENEYVIKKLVEFIELDDANKNELIVIKYLVKSNYKHAFKHFIEWIENDNLVKRNNNLSTEDIRLYNNPKAIADLITLIKISYKDIYPFDEIDSPIRPVYEAFKNICENNDPQTCLDVIALVKECKTELDESKVELFYINTMINDLQNIYYRLKSKPMTFHGIATKIKQYEYRFY
jgi:hypothetical protein